MWLAFTGLTESKRLCSPVHDPQSLLLPTPLNTQLRDIFTVLETAASRERRPRHYVGLSRAGRTRVGAHLPVVPAAVVLRTAAQGGQAGLAGLPAGSG